MDKWRELALCDKLPWEQRRYFFGDDPVMGAYEQHERARTHCYQCPSQIECLRWCVDEDMFWGVWGGLTESQRKRYLMPAIRKDGFTDEVMIEVLTVRGKKILRLIEEDSAPVVGSDLIISA